MDTTKGTYLSGQCKERLENAAATKPNAAIESFQNLAREAKARMKGGYWTSPDRLSDTKPKPPESRVAAATCADKIVSPAEWELNEREYKIVCTIFDANSEVLNPLMLLVGSEYWAITNQDERERYILRLSARYLKHKKRYLRERREKNNDE